MDIRRLFDISGKTALVTGATAGIGAMITEGLIHAGAKVWFCARSAEAVKARAAQLSCFGECEGVVADLAVQEGIDKVTHALERAGTLSILVNNAGASAHARIGRFPRHDFEQVLSVNLTAPFMLVQGLLPLLRAAAAPEDPARVINIASVNGMRAAPLNNYPYSSSKAALLMLTEHLGRMLASENITVNAVSPGFFPSQMTATSLSDPAFVAKVASPLGARVGTPEDIVGAVLYLSSRAGAWQTGLNLPVSGGRKVIDG